jgi:pimeloyl-ACP methyl ester carboxylesterase
VSGLSVPSPRIAWERRGAGAPVVLVHGLGYARWGWEPVADRLAERFEVLLLDNRGIGDSDAPPGPYTAAEMAADVARVLDEAGLERAHVVGTSLGGMIAQELALAHPDRVDRLVLACTTPGGELAHPIPAGTLSLIAEAATLEPAVALRRFVENALAPGAPRELVERILAHRVVSPQPLPAWQAQAAAGTTFAAGERVRGIRAPTLILHGTEDAVVDVRNADVLGGLIEGARVERFPACGHLFFWERPGRFVELVTEFLA